MSIQVEELLTQLKEHARKASYKHERKRFSVYCFCIGKDLNSALQLWGMGDKPRRPDEKAKQKIVEFWRKTLSACAPEKEESYDHCSEDTLLEEALRLHCLFAAIGMGTKSVAHFDSARYAAEQLTAVCTALLDKEQKLLMPPPRPSAEVIRLEQWRKKIPL